MAVNRLKYGQEIERELNKSKSATKAHERATRRAKIRKVRRRIRKSYLNQLKKTAQMLWYGPKYYAKVMKK